MSYRLVKSLFGTSNKNVICKVDLPYDVNDFCFIPNFGYLLALRDNHCISRIDTDGKLTISWLGELNKEGYEDGNSHFARLSYPSSICFSLQSKKAFVIESGGASVRSFDIDTAYITSLLGTPVISRLEKGVSKLPLKDINTFCCVDQRQQIFWTIDKTNKCYKFYQGDVTNILGNGKATYSVSSDVSKSSLNKPSGIAMIGDNIYVADTENHCIRELSKKAIRLFYGTPMEVNLVNTPSYLKYVNGLFYFLDGLDVKYYSLSGLGNGILYTGNNIVAIDTDGKDLLILEREDA